ncbi:MAG: GIY-YIG nuclease family protein [Candidatus Devosia phytovorans]|uniref:GIY-YIG nuclease family protein n=1 Tax=Candidatus Devosia phytovorans TaxID=3121372 RepID=A0AAJ5VTA0_9HYPH|nr:GIY-YIG nuclease family protein [Devosia sp.]WEK03510.1 MAG: GIY-YIG nuclease family protein [Devosia sp.]
MDVFVYMLRCSDGSNYVGLTKQDPEARLWEHSNKSYPGYTSTRTPVEMVFMEHYERIIDAIEREQQIKKWSRRKKEALIRGDYEALPELASRARK